ncbi:uncharacterized protein J7T54_007427 [Emericellopsis cladophorae]|uniref:Uncharacterized protein n=1 Tax=Emericellopsis cladophorae TaxID=2686198 RepID=A0A9Q0BC62_9HYPO|nr:uncharacterized protein J7T54_007427 [Emericellopsis cladophorae]KAI6778774.1 hypothetical protein J7T54_007427 [Emericellopsis cladophorae]
MASVSTLRSATTPAIRVPATDLPICKTILSYTVKWPNHKDGRGCIMAFLADGRRAKLISKRYGGVRKPHEAAVATAAPSKIRLKLTRKTAKAN